MADLKPSEPPTILKFTYFVLESSLIIRHCEWYDFIKEIKKFWVYDIIDMSEIWIDQETDVSCVNSMRFEEWYTRRYYFAVTLAWTHARLRDVT